MPYQGDAATNRAPLLDHATLSRELAQLASEHAERVTALGMATSRGGRKIEALRITGADPEADRPAILVVANVDGPFVYTSGLAVHHARRLAAGYGTDERITQLLDTTTVYIVPRANPDAAEARFESPLAEVTATGHGVDNDRDGRSGEDAPSDVNGDGFVSVMRVPDPSGEWIEDPTDPRVLRKAERSKGERGMYRIVPEGRDSDGDEEVGEDSPLDAVVNRNFAHDWSEHDPASGLFPTDEPEVRGLYELLLSKPDIQLVIVYGALDNVVEDVKTVADDAPRVRRVPPSGVRKSDATLLGEIARDYRDVTGDKTPGDGETDGSLPHWTYGHRGLITLAIRPWAIPLDTKTEDESDDGGEDGDEPAKKKEEEKPSDDAKRMKWVDAEGESARHLGWTAFDHPELGAVDIGGFAPYGLLEPPDDERNRIADVQLDFLLSLGQRLARVDLTDVQATSSAAGLVEIECAVENSGYLPLTTVAGRLARSVRPARVQLHLPEGAQLLAGPRQTLVRELEGSGGRHELRWLVAGAKPADVWISVDTDHAGSARAVPEVK